MRELCRTLTILCLLVVTAPIGQADVLVTRDGRHIQTDGPWEVKGRQVIFTSPEGRLSSIRLTEIDLDASELATNPPPPPPPPPEAERLAAEAAKKKPVLVLTDANIGGGVEAETFLGRVNAEVDRRMREMIDQAESSSEDGAQAEVDGVVERVDQAMALINETCSGYSTLDEPMTSVDQLGDFSEELTSCAGELEQAAQDLEDKETREIVEVAVNEMRTAASRVQSDPEAYLNSDGESEGDEEGQP